MTQAQDNDDAAWLATLAGQENTAADASTRAQAEALRTALLAQSQRMDSRVSLADEAQYQQLLFRLRREGLTGHASPLNQVVAWGRAQGQMAARTMASHNRWAWGLAACAVLVVGVALHLSRTQQGSGGPDMRMILRGQGTVLIVSDPNARATELLAGLKTAGVKPTVVQDKNGQVQLRFQPNELAWDYLDTQRIQAQPLDGWITITVVKWTPILGQVFKWDTVQRNGLPMTESKKRRVHPPEFKAKVGLEALGGMNEIILFILFSNLLIDES